MVGIIVLPRRAPRYLSKDNGGTVLSVRFRVGSSCVNDQYIMACLVVCQGSSAIRDCSIFDKKEDTIHHVA